MISPSFSRMRRASRSGGREMASSAVSFSSRRRSPGANSPVVGADDDGVVVVPQAVAHEVATYARAILLSDMRARRKHYDKLGMASDSSVDFDAVEAYFADL